jgi:hypothetical protein
MAPPHNEWGLGELLFPNSKTSDVSAKLRQCSYWTVYWNTGNRESIAGGRRDFPLKHSVKTDPAAQAFHKMGNGEGKS